MCSYGQRVSRRSRPTRNTVDGYTDVQWAPDGGTAAYMSAHGVATSVLVFSAMC